jgi:hypothetical protein
MVSESLLSLHDKLREDRWRARHAFSKDMQQAAKLMLKPFAYDHEVAESLRQWCMKRQPCQFGRAAASRNQIYFAVLRERDLADGDAAIRERIATAKRHWKQRAVSDTRTPPHSFLLACATDRLLMAAPDENLRRFADRLLELAGWAPNRRARRGENPVSSDFLYLQNPADDAYFGFQFNIDFFAAAGDRRWWHDHRLPAGIGFTANSTGHMKAFLDWYREPGADHGEWALKQAMITIAQAHPAKSGDTKSAAGSDPRAEGRLTWLRSLDPKGRPLVAHLLCPLKNPPKQLDGKDWTRYEGLIHTDHAVREEFFADREEPVAGQAPHIQDLTYLFDQTQDDFINFTAGKPFTTDEVFADLGGAVTWTRRTGDYAEAGTRSSAEDGEAAELMRECATWTPSEDYLDSEVPG